MSDLIAALRIVLSSDVTPRGCVPVGGCGRVYIELSDMKVRSNSKIVKEAEALGFKMTLRPYHGNNHSRLYMGYDNATGYEWFRAENVAAILRNNGIKCYVDGDGD